MYIDLYQQFRSFSHILSCHHTTTENFIRETAYPYFWLCRSLAAAEQESPPAGQSQGAGSSI